MDPWEGLFYTYHQIEMVCVPTTTTLIPIASFNKSLVRDFANNKMSIKIHMLLPLPPLLWQPAILIEDTRSSHTCTYKNDNIHHHSVAYSFYEAAKQTDSRVCGWQSDIPKIILWWTKGRIKWGGPGVRCYGISTSWRLSGRINQIISQSVTSQEKWKLNCWY